MLTIIEIENALKDILPQYPIKKLSIFGSYANGKATENSDVDMLVEFSQPNVSLFLLSDIKEIFKSRLNKEVDLIHGPLEDEAYIKINKVIDIYEQ